MSILSTDGSTTTSSTVQQRGRPRKSDAKSCAERAKTYRQRLKADGRKEVKCFLGPEHLAYLDGLCKIYGGTIADAVALALTVALTGECSTPAPVHRSPQKPSLILLQ